MILFFIFVPTFLYLLLLLAIVISSQRSNTYSPTDQNRNQDVSILIAARNEEKNIKRCLESIIKSAEYANVTYQIIVINDHSDDLTSDVILRFKSKNVSVVDLPSQKFGKKSAIAYGISLAKFENILTTDADCNVAVDWVSKHLLALTKHGYVFSTGNVIIANPNNLIQSFQALDFCATMAITKFGIKNKLFYLANGANMSYKKELFISLNGYNNNLHIASGDDVFLIQNIAKINPDLIIYTETTVSTQAESTWKSLIKQRLRWASKASIATNNKLLSIQALILLTSVLPFLLIALSLLIFSFYFVRIALVLILLKGIIDFVFLFYLSRQSISRGTFLKYFIPSFFVYYGHIFLSSVAALIPINYKWKNRVH